jgi:outer membrane protein OmpA-like peptidoglycan-associated protein
MKPRLLSTALALAITALAAPAWSADDAVRLYRQNETVDPQHVAAILGAAKPKFRSLRLLDDDVPEAKVASAQAAAAAGKPSSLALPVQFAFDSHDILPAARAQLDALAEGIRLLPAERSIAVEGHTDALGSEEYNARLSMRRALAVKRYLVAQHGIDAARLRPIGMGKVATLPGRDPLAPENRRVQFRGEGVVQ